MVIPAKVKACNGQLACVTRLDRSVAGTLGNDLQQSLEQICTDYNTLGTALTNS
jgi:hypothetical protein